MAVNDTQDVRVQLRLAEFARRDDLFRAATQPVDDSPMSAGWLWRRIVAPLVLTVWIVGAQMMALDRSWMITVALVGCVLLLAERLHVLATRTNRRLDALVELLNVKELRHSRETEEA